MTKHAEDLAKLGWQYFECPACGSEGARAFPKPEQEPVAWTLLLVGEHHGIIGKAGDAFASAPEHYRRVDVYTTPPQRKPLTDEEMQRMAKRIEELEAMLEQQTARIVDLQTHIANLEGE